eukprot:SAG31_NODE_40930_length_278_cov_0.871508_1_plen_30_part_01
MGSCLKFTDFSQGLAPAALLMAPAKTGTAL